VTTHRSAQSGFTLLETMIVLAVSGLVLTSLAAITTSILRVPVKTQSETTASSQLQNATLIITEDANSARTFTAGTSTDYGTFEWFELSGTTPIEISARYYWADEKLYREYIYDAEVASIQVVIEPVLEQDDVTFTYSAPTWTYVALTKEWTYAEGEITVTFTATSDAGAGFPDTTITATLRGDFRPQKDRPVPLPGRLAPATPPANQVNFKGASINLITGNFLNGSVASLTFDDTNYYNVRGTGSPRVVEYEVTSEVIDYTSISSISVEFTGQVTDAGTAQSIFVYNTTDHGPTGYDASPDSTSVYTNNGVDQTVLIQFGDDDVDYVDSLGSKVVKIKVYATYSALFTLRSDRLVFKVAGTPSATFSRDFLVDTEPTLETGTISGGTDYTGLGADDTSYYDVKNASAVVQWQAVSEAINLDTMTSTEVRFIGRVTGGAPTTLQFFVFNPANGGDGFPVTANATSTYASNNTDFLTTFFLSPADLAYAASLFPKEVRIRVKATAGTGTWRLQGDHLVFRVKP
jgi:prepilin-type N-terminal cleavage/methylation domain-containing protein